MPLTNKKNPTQLPPCPEIFPGEGDLRRASQVGKAPESKEGRVLSESDLAHTRSKSIPLDLTPTCAARVLGFALLYSPSGHGRDTLAAEILGCGDSENDHELLSELAHWYVYGLIRLSHNPKTGTPIVSTEQGSVLYAQEAAANLRHLIEKPSLTAKQLKKLVMTREGGSCPFTGRIDKKRFAEGQPGHPESLEVAHIITQSFSKGTKEVSSEEIEGESERARQKLKLDWTKTSETMIENPGGFSTRDPPGGQNLNSPRNAMLLAPVVHRYFDKLDLWLTPFEDGGKIITDKYKVNFAYPTWPFRKEVTFQAYTLRDGKEIKPPSPELIALHAACAMIAHKSSAAELLMR